MDVNPKEFYTYFKECYKLDYKEFSVDNLLSQKYKYKWFVRKTEGVLQDHSHLVYYDHSKIKDLEYELEFYKLEKKLFYASFFVLGKNTNHLSKDKRYCSPLLLHPATITTIEDDKFIKIDHRNYVINRSVLSKLDLIDESKTKDLFLNDMNDFLSEDYPDFIQIKSILDSYFSNIDTEELLLFPQVWPISKIRKFFTTNNFEDNTYKIVPAAGSCVVKKSESSLRVLNDLGEIANLNTFNSSLEQLLKRQVSKNEYKTSFFSSRLNSGQYDALQNAYTYDNSVIIGPPGTGKTYTISSIVADAVVKNQSVLVVSKTKQAVEVIRDMLQNDFKLKDYLIHTTGHHYKMSLKSKINRYLSGISANRYPELNETYIKRQFKQLKTLEQEFEKAVENELDLSRLQFSNNQSFFDKWKLFYKKHLTFGEQELWEIFEAIENQLKFLEREINLYSKKRIQQNILHNSDIYRTDIAIFHEALDAFNFSEYKKKIEFVDYKNIIRVFPIWLANLSDLNSVLPAEENLFDLVIIDEATQCDIATALPALYRGKRAVIVGDPNQLRHYSFVSRMQQKSLREKLNLPDDRFFDYRTQSILDLYISKVKEQSQVSFLREHFRSTPSIIEFSNRHFYNGQLQILKSTPKHTSHDQIKLIEVNGTRNKKGINEKEARKVIDILDQLMVKHNGEKLKPSIGIISPFSSQVNFINELLRDAYDLSILKRFDVFCGTPYNFQGSEREIVILSFAVCNDSHSSAFLHASKPEVLNVAITRAKSFQYVLKSVSDEKLKDYSLLKHYFRFIKEFSHIDDDHQSHDKFQEEVVKALNKEGFADVKCGYPLAGSLLDILVQHKERYYFIDLIGYPGVFEDAFSLERYKTLARTGIKSFPLHYTLWQKHKKEVMYRLKVFLR